MEEMLLFIYKNILGQLKDSGYNTNRLRKEKILSESVIQSLRDESSITLKNLNIICNLLKCQPNDLIEHIPDDNEK